MTTLIPVVMAEVARSLRKTIAEVGLLNGDIDAPLPEDTLNYHIAAEFVRRQYAVYAQARYKNSRERLDLLAADASRCFIIEAKTAGRPDSQAFLEDCRKLARFEPDPATRSDGKETAGFWHVSDRFPTFALLNFRTNLVDQWSNKTIDSFSTELGDFFRSVDALLHQVSVTEENEFTERTGPVSILTATWAL